jgi:hypothetical protein
MAKPPALKAALDKIELENAYRSSLEKNIADELDAAGIKYDYEDITVEYEVPARTAKYKPDFPIRDTNIIIEGKGHFGGKASFRGRIFNMTENSARERHKFALLKEQHPELDIRFVFSRASAPIYKGSKTTHAKWATDHGFKWSHKTIPPEWIDDMKKAQRKSK